MFLILFLTFFPLPSLHFFLSHTFFYNYYRGFSNIPQWIGELDKKIESIIADRLRAACGVWLQAFITGNSSSQMTDDNRKKEVNRDGGREGIVEIQPTIHEILLSNQILYLSPPIEMARSECISAFYSYTSIVATLPRIAGSRFQGLFWTLFLRPPPTHIYIHINSLSQPISPHSTIDIFLFIFY